MATDKVFVREDLSAILAGRDPFAFFAGLEGEIFRELESRRTWAVELGGKRYFVKYHRGTGTGEIVKNLLQLRLPVTGAANEWRALTRLKAVGIAVPEIAAFGKRGWLPQNAESFIVTDDVGTQENLEELTRTWREQPPTFSDKLALLREVAAISRQMHSDGICHRDFYICHFLVSNHKTGRLTLIDLHRALVKKHLPGRWVIKDIGSLFFSAMDIGLGQRDLLRFVRFYSASSLRKALQDNHGFWEDVVKRARKLKARHG